MFTFGIFTTHLPYIALVVFYAFFWIFGVNKASSGELEFGKSRISAEIQSGEIRIETVQGKTFDSHNIFDLGFLPPDRNEMFAALQMLKHEGYHFATLWQYKYYRAFISRPPPFIS